MPGDERPDDPARELAERLAALEADRADLDQQIGQLRAVLAAAVAPGTVLHDRHGHPLYELRPGKRTFNQALALERLPEQLRDACSRTQLDGAAVKRLSPALWEECCRTGEPFLQAVRR